MQSTEKPQSCQRILQDAGVDKFVGEMETLGLGD